MKNDVNADVKESKNDVTDEIKKPKAQNNAYLMERQKKVAWHW